MSKQQHKTTEWFAVDREGFAEMHANFPCERMVMELVQNVWDEPSTICAITIHDMAHAGSKYTEVCVEDDNPEGFKNLRDAYTLFGSTAKRADPTKRGRFNYGEKIVLARAVSAKIATTKGTVTFDKAGRTESTACRKAGSVITVVFKRWTAAQTEQALKFLQRLYPPAGIKTTINGVAIPDLKALKEHKATLPTEFLKDVDGHMVMTKTKRQTTMLFYPKRDNQAFLYEMGLPVCDIDGPYDVNIMQKIPLSQDRTTVPLSFVQDIYAETLNAMHDQMDVSDMDKGSIKLAMEDERMDVPTTKDVFHKICGENAVIQSHNADADQEAARQGVSMVPSRMFGSAVNTKLREGGVKTTNEMFARDITLRELEGTMPADFKRIELSDPVYQNFVAYVKFMAEHLYGDKVFQVDLAKWTGAAPDGLNEGGHHVIFNVMKLGRDKMACPVSRCSSLVIHELAHCKGSGHDGVYDHEYERNVDRGFALLARRPELFRTFEPALFAEATPA